MASAGVVGMGKLGQRRNDAGAAAVEFALVSIILIMLIVGIVQFGFVFNQWLQVEHAAREGVRWASLRNGSAAVKAHAIASAPGIDLTAGDITVTPADPMGAQPNAVATVVVAHSVPVIMPLMDQFLGPEVNLTATAVQRIE